MKLIIPSLALIGLVASKALPESEDLGLIGDFNYEMNNEDCYEDNTDSQAGNIEDDLIIPNELGDSTEDADCEDEPVEEVDLLDVIIAEPAIPEDDTMYVTNMDDIYDEECEEDPDTVPTEITPDITEPPQPPQPATQDPDEIYNADCISDDYGETPSEPDTDYNPLENLDGILDNANHAYTDVDDMLVGVDDVEGEGDEEGFEECIEY